jgi:hypothetical protein
MPQPTDSATWATDGGTRVEPSAGEKADGFTPGARTPARKANWIVGVVADWAAWLESITNDDGDVVYNDGGIHDGRERCTVLTPFVGFAGMSGAGDETASIDPWRVINVSTPTTEGQVLQSGQIFAGWVADLSARFPTGATITRIRVAVQPGAERATVGNRMTLWLAEGALDLATGVVSWTGPLETSTDDGSTDEQFIDTGTIAVFVAPSIEGAGASGPSGSTLHLHVNAGNDADTNRDQIRMIVVNWFDPGPRNF